MWRSEWGGGRSGGVICINPPSLLPSLLPPSLPPSIRLSPSEINHYLLVAAGSTIHQLSLDVSNVADIVLPITGIVNAVSVDEDIMEGVVYWSDDVAAGIGGVWEGGSGGKGGEEKLGVP